MGVLALEWSAVGFAPPSRRESTSKNRLLAATKQALTSSIKMDLRAMCPPTSDRACRQTLGDEAHARRRAWALEWLR